MRHSTSLLACLLLMPSPASHAGMTHIDSLFGLRHEGNLSRAESSRDAFSDAAIVLDLTAQWSEMLSANSGLRLSGHVGLTEQLHYDDLSQMAFGAGARYRVQPVAGYTAPWLEVAAGLERLQFRDSDIRDGLSKTFDILLGKRFTDRISGRIGYGREWRSADEGSVFEWRRNQLSALADYSLGQDSRLYLRLAHLRGDQVFTATPNPAIRNFAKAIADDLVFGQRRAYRLDALTNTVEIGLHHNIGPSTALDFGVIRFRADANGGHRYDDTEIRLNWLYRFK